MVWLQHQQCVPQIQLLLTRLPWLNIFRYISIICLFFVLRFVILFFAFFFMCSRWKIGWSSNSYRSSTQYDNLAKYKLLECNFQNNFCKKKMQIIWHFFCENTWLKIKIIFAKSYVRCNKFLWKYSENMSAICVKF